MKARCAAASPPSPSGRSSTRSGMRLGFAFSLFVALAAIGLVFAVALLPFGGIERIFGYGAC